MVAQEQAIEIAKQELAKHGFQVADFVITIDPENDSEWAVWFEKKGPYRVPGGRHAVLVDKDTGNARFLGGE